MQRQNKERKKSEKYVPSVAKDYTEKGMGHVDTFNADLSRSEAKHKNFVWRRTIFLSLLKIVLVNSWIFFKHSHNLKEDFNQKDFLQNLQKEFEDYTTEEKISKKNEKKDKNTKSTIKKEKLVRSTKNRNSHKRNSTFCKF